MATQPVRVRLRVGRDAFCAVEITAALGAVSPVLKTIKENHEVGDDETVVDLRARLGHRTPPSAILGQFMDFLSRVDGVAPLALLPHTTALIEVADFLGIDADIQFKVPRWIGARTTSTAMYARVQLARRDRCLFFVAKVINAWFEYFRCADEICFACKRAVPQSHFKNSLNDITDGEPFVYVLDAPNAHVPVVVIGRLPPSSAPLSSEEGAGNLQREWMNDLYQLCADDEGRDLLVRTISRHPLRVRALRFVAVTTDRKLNNIEEWGATAFLVSIGPRPSYCDRGDRNGDRDGGRRADESMQRRSDQGHSRPHSSGQKRDRST